MQTQEDLPSYNVGDGSDGIEGCRYVLKLMHE